MNKAANIPFAEISSGLKVSFEKKITEDTLNIFLKLSGDFSPLHVDEAYAASTPFKHRVVPGMLLASYFSQLVGMHLPGTPALYVSQTLQFRQPVFIGDTIVVNGEVTAVSAAAKILTISTTIINKKDKRMVVEGEARVLYR